jgi:uncharacterized protein (TIGR02147 family)
MDKLIFEYLDYKLYLNEKIDQSPSKGRGIKLALAKFIGCQTAYISQVLRKDTQFNLEQGVKVNQFFGHTREEGKFFLLLIQYARAGSKDLEIYCKEEIEEIIKKRENLKERFQAEDSLDEPNHHIYYSAWYYSAAHIMLSVPEFRTQTALQKALNIPIEKVQEILEFLTETGLAIQEGSQYNIGKTRIFLDKDSVYLSRHLLNWRNQAIQSVDRYKAGNLHFSNVVSMSKKDFPKIREIFVKAIEDSKKIIKDSKEEEVNIMNMDFFTL